MLVNILVPMTDNDGVPFSTRARTDLTTRATELFGGVSLLPGSTIGSWKDNSTGIRYDDTLQTWQVKLSSIADGEKVGRLVRFIKDRFRQEAVFVSYMGQAEIL